LRFEVLVEATRGNLTDFHGFLVYGGIYAKRQFFRWVGLRECFSPVLGDAFNHVFQLFDVNFGFVFLDDSHRGH
jgi:hypothetical protein